MFMWSHWSCTVSLSVLCLQELIITTYLKNIHSKIVYIFCTDLFLKVRQHCCWVSIVVDKKKLICVNVDDFKTVVVILMCQNIEFANFHKTSRKVKYWHLQRFIHWMCSWTILVHWVFLKAMIVKLCVRNSSIEKKQIDKFEFDVYWLKLRWYL